jgi:inner membrane protein
MLVAETAVELRGRGKASAEWRGLVYLASIVANNLPDLDIVYVGITGGKLGYLLHHRGHTHTLVAAFASGLVIAFTMRAMARWRSIAFDSSDWRWLLGVSLAGGPLHIAMDFANSYGVHPFWPLSSRWFFGDVLFIVEPLLWLGASVPLAFLARTRRRTIGLVVLTVVLLAMVWWQPIVPLGGKMAVTAFCALLAAWCWRASDRARTVIGVGSFVAVGALFAMAGAVARRALADVVRASFPGAIAHDAALTPMPANPLCWSSVAVHSEGSRYVVRIGMLSLAPTILPASQCPPQLTGEPTAPLAPVPAPASDRAAWVGQFAAPLADLRELAGGCHAAAYLRFSRTPYWIARDGALWLGDLRFDRDRALGFSELMVPGDAACPRNVPSWSEPRAELLR